MRLTIPVQLPPQNVEFSPSPYGDPYTLEIKLAPSLCGQVILPRDIFSESFLKKLDGEFAKKEPDIMD